MNPVIIFGTVSAASFVCACVWPAAVLLQAVWGVSGLVALVSIQALAAEGEAE